MNPEEETEKLLDEIYWVIDPLPRQAPPDSEGQYFAVEREWLKIPHNTALRRRFLAILLKLNCYFDLAAQCLTRGGYVLNPAPETLGKWLLDGANSLTILFPLQHSLFTLYSGDACMAVHAPSDDLLELLRCLVPSEGMFLWQPPQAR